MTTNPELAAALATVPEIERTERLLDEAKRRLVEHPAGVAPDAARNSVIDEAVSKFQADGTWPADLGKRAAKAYTTALEWEAERIARQRAKDSTELLAYDTRQLLASDALTHLGTRLDEVLSDARTAAETLGDVRTADAAIKAGVAVVDAWGRLQSLVEDLANIRAAQWSVLDPGPRPRSIVGDADTDQRRQLREWRRQGYGEVRGSAVDEGRTGRYTEIDLLWLASTATAYVPTFEDLQDDAGVADMVDVGVPDDSVTDTSSRWQPREQIIPEPPAPKPTGAERTPELSY